MFLPIELIRVILKYNEEYWVFSTPSVFFHLIPLKSILDLPKPYTIITADYKFLTFYRLKNPGNLFLVLWKETD
jgi:hypothetical protein